LLLLIERRNLIISTEQSVSMNLRVMQMRHQTNLCFALFPTMVCNTKANASFYSLCSCLSADHSEITEEQTERNQKLAVAFVDETCNLHFDTAIKKFHRSGKGSAACSSRSQRL